MKNTIGSLMVFLAILLGFMAIPEGFVLSSESEKSTKDIAGFWRHDGQIIEIDGTKAINVYIKERNYQKFLNTIEIKDIRRKGNTWVGKQLYWDSGEWKKVTLSLWYNNRNKMKVGRYTYERMHKKEAIALIEKQKKHIAALQAKRKQVAGKYKTGTGTTFRMKGRKGRETVTLFILGSVPSEIDLTDDELAFLVLEEAIQFSLKQKEIPLYPGKSTKTEVFLRYKGKEYKECRGGSICDYAYEVRSESNFYENGKDVVWKKHRNYALDNRRKAEAKKLEEQKEADLKAKKERERAARKAEEQRKKAEAHERLDKFMNKYGVRDWPSMKRLSVNPFVYEGKTVAMVSKFKTMVSATEGLFESEDKPFLVSSIPKGLFTSEAHVVIAGRVLGKKEAKFPVVGTVLVPHLKFVGVHLCRDRRCGDIIAE